MRNCRKCGRYPWNDNEKNTSICDFCRNFGRDKDKCMKYGRALWNSNEKNTSLCDTCRTYR